MPKIKVNGVEIHYNDIGKGKETLLFSHGYLMNSSMFKGPIDEFKNNFRCISFDHRGHGESEVTANGYELDNLVTDAINLIEELKIEPVHFIGMSTGGFVGMRIALRRPELLKSMILMDTSAEEESKITLKKNESLLWIVKNIGWTPVISKVMSIMFHETFLNDKSRRSEVKKWRKIVKDQDLKGMIPFGKMIFTRNRVLEKLANLNIPTAVIVGEDDVATPLEYNKRIADMIPNSSFYTIPNAGHAAAVEKPEEVNTAMKTFYSKMGLI